MSSLHSVPYQKLLQRLRQARQESMLTQEEVARELGKPQSFVSKSESGERRLDPIELLMFARVYRRRIDSLLDDSLLID